MLSPLEQLYLETTSKEDLLAEIKDQQRKAEEISELASTFQRKVWQMESEIESLLNLKNEVEELKSKNRKMIALLSNYRRKHNIKPRTSVRADIITLMEQGLRNKEIIERGFNKNTVESVRAMIKKALAQNE